MENTEKRIDDLEIKFTFQEDLLTQLNDIVTNQQFTIDKLEKEIKLLRSSIEDPQAGESGNLADEKPPHY